MSHCALGVGRCVVVVVSTSATAAPEISRCRSRFPFRGRDRCVATVSSPQRLDLSRDQIETKSCELESLSCSLVRPMITRLAVLPDTSSFKLQEREDEKGRNDRRRCRHRRSFVMMVY